MPKERLHILLAQESFRMVAELGRYDPPADQDHLLAAILPDMFFYDPPTFRLGSYGRRLHRFEGRTAMNFCLDWLQQDGAHLNRVHKQWMLGFVGHFLADGRLHPLINGNCRRFGKEFKLSFRSCHHWLESELEAYWLATIGPPDGFLRLLDAVAAQSQKTTELLGFLRAFLSRAGLTPIPSESAMRGCFNRQVRLLRLFADPRWTTMRPWLIRFRFTQPFGVLLAPTKREDRAREARSCRPNPCHDLSPLQQNSPLAGICGTTSLPSEIEAMFKPSFMARTILYLSSHLLELVKLF